MLKHYSLAPVTVLSLSPPEAIEAAARIGYQYVGLRLFPATPGGAAYPLMDDPVLLRETLALQAATGVGVFDLEIIRIGEDFDVNRYLPFFEVGQQLGAKAMLVAADDRDEARLTAAFAGLCEAAEPYGLTADLEFMPWTAVPDLTSARRIVEAAGSPPNAGILVDALHFARSSSRPEQLQTLPRQWLHYAQICDAPAGIPATDAELIHTARCERLLPGEGGIDLRSLFGQLPGDLPISVEIPNDLRAPALGAEAWARQALQAVKTVITPA